MRPIDADALNIRSYCRWFDDPDDIRGVERMIREAPTITPPLNDPLSLEELREMNGEPVWIVGVSSINNFKGHWDICNLGGDLPAFPYCGENPDISLYGITWIAYRRKPEEGTV